MTNERYHELMQNLSESIYEYSNNGIKLPVISNRGGSYKMYRYEFTYSYMKPEVHVFKVVVDAYNDADAYYQALYEIARHVISYKTMNFEAPGEAKLTCVKKGKI